MWFALLKRSDWRLLRAAIVGFSLVVLVLAWGITLQRLEAEKTLALDTARRQQNNLAIIVTENLEQLLEGGHTIALAASEWWAGSPKEVEARLSVMRASHPAFLRLALYDLEGRRLYSSSPSADDPAVTAALQEVLASPSERHAKPRPLPVASTQPGTAWHKPLLFPVGWSPAEPLGMLIVTFDLGYLLQVYQHIQFGASGVIHILTEEARELLEWRPEGLVLKNVARHFPAFTSLSDGTGALSTELFQDGQQYLSSFRRAERFSFLLVVSRSEQDILGLHEKARSQSLSTLGFLTLLIAAGTYLFAAGIGRQGRLFSALVASNEKNRVLIARLEDERGRAFRLAAHDHLTGLPNRRTFNELVTSHLSKARRHGGQYALMYLDLDRFKLINDTLGHLVGDIVLQTVASRLRVSLRESDVVARLGGDEFAILVMGFNSVDDLNLIAKKIIQQISEPFEAQAGTEIRVGPSIGIAIFPRDGHDLDSLCKSADAAMYESKRKGRGTYTYYDAALNPSSEKKFNLEQRFARALADQELVLHFQPQVRLSDFRIVGFEALVRWKHPELGLIYPDDFIPFAEETGQILALDAWVARACCRQLSAWRSEGIQPVPVSINLSALHLQREELPERIDDVLAEYGLPAEMLGIEITETVLLDSLEAADKVLSQLESRGIQISLDDFGSGFSSLSYVRMLPIHVIKIDKQFVRDIRNSTHDAVLVSSIISLAQNLGIRVIAEGVETLEQLIHLKTAGCDRAQGYYFSRPVPAADARNLLLRGELTPA